MTSSGIRFQDLNLPENILRAITELGYETPSPIQEQAITPILEGRDILGQAQTGTGKTAAFALPLLANITTKQKEPQVLILAPTRELAIQVAEACQSYAKYLDDFHVLPIYGGQGYSHQLRQLKRGAQIIVGTPGRVMDHMRRGTLTLDKLSTLVLDEADEMLRMGFIDDVEWILEHTPQDRQIALFSATMPRQIKKVAEEHLNKPEIVKIENKTATATTINQRYMLTTGIDKIEALTRVLEIEEFDGVIIFVKTKVATEELASKLNARGYFSSPLNGDIPQAAREKTVDKLKKGKIDILVATDVVARGLDVERVSHVINFDVPYDTESYVHRIGRTGRAGRSGDAILFITPREKRMLRSIEKATSQQMARMDVPTANEINEIRVEQFKANIVKHIEGSNLDLYRKLLNELIEEQEINPLDAAAALAHLLQGSEPLFLDPNKDRKINQFNDDKGRGERGRGEDRKGDRSKRNVSQTPRPLKEHPDIKLERFRINVGRNESVKPQNIVGAIANTIDLDSEFIGQIEIYESYSTVDLPEGMPNAVLAKLRKTRVMSKPMELAPIREHSDKKGSSKGKQRDSRGKQGAPKGKKGDSFDKKANSRKKPSSAPRKRKAKSKSE